MKKIIIICIFLLAVFAGCKGTSNVPSEAITQELCEELFIESAELYNLFYVCAAEGDNADAFTSDSGEIYYMIADEKISTKERMDDRLRNCFSDEIVLGIWEDSPYIEQNGFLYTNECAVGADVTICREEYSFEEQTKTCAVYTAQVGFDDDFDEIEDRSEVYEFVLEYIDDRWVFTEYPCYW